MWVKTEREEFFQLGSVKIDNEKKLEWEGKKRQAEQKCLSTVVELFASGVNQFDPSSQRSAVLGFAALPLPLK